MLKFLKYLLIWFFPVKCTACNIVLEDNYPYPLCSECLSKLNNAKRLSSYDLNCPDIKLCYCLYKYRNDIVKRVVYHIKFKGYDILCEYLANEMLAIAKVKGLLTLADVITYAPRRKTEKRRIGFDQAYLIAKALSLKMNLELDDLLARVGSSKKQRTLTATGRAANVKGKFAAKKEVKDKRILLIDDVVTTGATVCECAKVLKEAGAKTVYVLAVAK